MLLLLIASPVLAFDGADSNTGVREHAQGELTFFADDDAANGDTSVGWKGRGDKAGQASWGAKKSKKKKGKRDKKKAEEEEKKEAEESEPEEEYVEPDAWERPPPEEEAPPAEKARPLKAPVVGDGRPIGVGLVLGYGFKTDRGEGGYGTDPYGFGAGLTGGYTLFEIPLYIGVYFNYYLGSSDTGPLAGVPNATSEATASYMHFGAEAGYELWLDSLVIRPSLQLGLALAIFEQSGSPIDGTETQGSLAFNPGVTFIFPIDQFYLGIDGRAMLVTGDGVSAVGVFGTGGMRFE